MRVVVLGGAGAMGRVCVRDLVSSGVEEVVVADRDEAAATEVAGSAQGPGTARAQSADATDHDALVRLLESADVVANCTNYALNVRVMRAAAAAGTHYLDLGGLFHGTNAQAAISSEIEDAGILCLLGMGSTPGTMNVMAALAAERLDEVHEIHLRCGGNDPEPARSPLPAPYAIDTILDEFTIPGVALVDGELVEVPPASQDERFSFPEPVGAQLALLTLHSELASMPKTFADRGVTDITFKVAFGDAFIASYRTVCNLGLAATEPVALGDTEVVPRDLLKRLASSHPQEFSGRDTESLVVVVRGTKDGRPHEVRVEEISPPNETFGVGGADANTGIPPSIVAQMIARGEVTGKGVCFPEEVVPAVPYLDELRKRGMALEVREGPPSKEPGKVVRA
jgi:lysine 6-dehydrogenase